ncbi:helicase and polymerase-containing protein TEBICHI-like isoform X2 [Selaginella moellendorffii]|uniref:helicase and polymerase-containing protein TEBICHI-like isoform X2 n=1 Tax=Selaginella moellendorffii TaxID=88036 RepID=UPI000D1C7417|nr:helicase and polymerase-containing protein TEBICHI-like isoform X2 [Selaginella moellendorffii]|eukprot:XP_024519372.1 helicase and polymerase-containing protein TEBICHI-like isoform X2 [Selaginella moellendorffii]
MELEPDWGVYCQRFVELTYVDQAVARVGVTEASLMRMAHGAPMQGRKRSLKASEKASEANQNLRVYRRFFVALILSKLVQAARARCLYKAGVRTVEVVAEATIPELANALCDSSFKEHAVDVWCSGKENSKRSRENCPRSSRRGPNSYFLLEQRFRILGLSSSWSNDSAFAVAVFGLLSRPE